MTWQIGSLVWIAGKVSNRFSARGVIEEIQGSQFGVRLENGKFRWAEEVQLQPRAY